jgi:adenine deaminase
MQEGSSAVSGNIVDVVSGRIFPAMVLIAGGKIVGIREGRERCSTYIVPGLVDAHVHIESSMLTPHEFARMALTHGTLCAVCDPHEIANVLGMAGISYMLENARTSPFLFSFGAPSCVPATAFETSGAVIGSAEIRQLLEKKEISHLSEVMNYPGVLSRNPEVMAKIDLAKRLGKPIDGHAPGLRGDALKHYVAAGITTDHETLSLEEAIEKIDNGMKILIREGSAAKDFEKLHSLIDSKSDMCMFCSDDMHPDDLAEGHMDKLVRMAIGYNHDPMKVLKCACLNPVVHYGLPMGLLREGDPADFLVVDSLENFTVLKTYIKGMLVAEEGKPLLEHVQPEIINAFHVGPKRTREFAIRAGAGPANIIVAVDGQLITGWIRESPGLRDGWAVSDPDRDILKIAVVNRYHESPMAIGFIKGFGLKKGAIASSVAHDSHNIVAVGVTDDGIGTAVNMVIENKGGLAVVCGELREVLPLPIAGLMSDADAWEVASRYSRIQGLVQGLGSLMSAPFITLSFMALLVIPRLKLSDQGLFDAEDFIPIDVFAEH